MGWLQLDPGNGELILKAVSSSSLSSLRLILEALPSLFLEKSVETFFVKKKKNKLNWKTYKQRIPWNWVNDDRILICGWTIASRYTVQYSYIKYSHILLNMHLICCSLTAEQLKQLADWPSQHVDLTVMSPCGHNVSNLSSQWCKNVTSQRSHCVLQLWLKYELIPAIFVFLWMFWEQFCSCNIFCTR